MPENELIINLEEYPDEGIFEISAFPENDELGFSKSRSLLLIIFKGKYHIIENKCGHFGMPLLNGRLRDNEIVCAEHGISFDLETGNVVNRPYENCEPIKVYDSKVKGHCLITNDL